MYFVIENSNIIHLYCADSGHTEANEATLPEEERSAADKLRLVKDKISSNFSALPIVLKRMKETTSKIDKLESYDGIIHPAFKKKRPS